MKLSLLNRFLNIFALILNLTTICTGAGVLLKKGKSGCRLSSLEKLELNIVSLVCEDLNGIQNFTEFIPEGGKLTKIAMWNSYFTVLVDNQLYKMDLLQLEILRVSPGNLEKIEDGAFKGGDTIQELDLSENLIESLDPAVFRFLPNLERLYLGLNKLKHFSENGVFPNIKLRDLALDSNKIEKLNPNLFSKVNNLSVLLLSHNRLKYLDVKILPPNLSHVSLYSNRWECNCKFKEMMESLKVLHEKNNLHLEDGTKLLCTKDSKTIAYDVVKLKWGNWSKSCTPEMTNSQKTDAESTKLNTTNSNEMAESNHLGFILLSILVVIGMAVLAGVGFWVKKRTTVENGRVNFVTMTEDEE